MVRPGRDRLIGPVEVDETYIGGREEGFRGRGTKRKAIVVVAAEIRGRATGRIRLRRVPDASGDSLVTFISEVVQPDSVVNTDDWSGYDGLKSASYDHLITTIKGSGSRAHEVMPRVHRVASLLKRWLLGTMQGGVQHFHLDYYLDEFTFRFNRRRSRSRGLLFHRLVQQALATDPVPYRRLVAERSGDTRKNSLESSG
jgi:transposase-like protein